MNGPFTTSTSYRDAVLDADNNDVCVCEDRATAEMVCNALNAVYYAQQAAKTTPQGAADHDH